MDRCTLCGGRLNADRICTECGMDNKKDDSQYRLNENLPVEQPGAIPRDTGQRGPGGQTGAGPRPGNPGRGGYGYGSFPKAGSRGSTPRQNSGLAGKIVFVVVLVTVILSAVLGFLQEEKQAVTETSSEDWEIPDWEALSEQREFTITSETGEVSAGSLSWRIRSTVTAEKGICPACRKTGRTRNIGRTFMPLKPTSRPKICGTFMWILPGWKVPKNTGI